MMNRYSIFVILIGVIMALPFVYIARVKKVNRPSLPRFVSIKSSEVNIRKGPGLQYPIKWVYTKKNEPLKVLNEAENWRQIVDIDNEEGWVHSSVLSPKRFVITTSSDALYDKPGKNIIAEIDKNLRCKFLKCSKGWCKVECNSTTGWAKTSLLWGLYEDEIKN
jgi:SH3-like domain-containing protein